MDNIINILGNNILNIFVSIGKANFIAIIIVLFSYIIEKTTKLRLLIDSFTWKKSPLNVEAAATRDSGNYLILNIIVLIYDIYNNRIELHILTIVVWAVLIVILIQIFYSIHSKYQAVDPNKSDDNYT